MLVVVICNLGFVGYGSSGRVLRSVSSIQGHHAMWLAFGDVSFRALASVILEVEVTCALDSWYRRRYLVRGCT